MRKFLFLFLFASLCNISMAQITYPYRDIKLEKPADYKATESMALSAATLLITTPFVEVDEGRAGALIFLNAWMAGTKDYQFYFAGIAQDISVDKNLLSLFIAAMAKYMLENKSEVNPIKIEQQSAKILLAFCDDPKNNFKLKKKLRKLLEDHQPPKN